MPVHPADSSEQQRLITGTTWWALGLYIAWGIPISPILAYIDGMMLGVAGEVGWRAVSRLLPPLFLAVGIAYPYLVLRLLVRRALEHRLEDVPGARLERLLRLPWRAAFLCSCVAWTLGGLFFSLGVCFEFGRPLWRIAASTLIGLCCGTVLAFPFGLGLEQRLLPLALEEQRRYPAVMPSGRGLSWPRHSWLLPFASVSSSLCVLLLGGSLVLVKLMEMRDGMHAWLLASGAGQAAELVRALGAAYLSELGSSLIWIGGLVLFLPTLTAWLLARRLASGTLAVRMAIEALATGKVRSPDWISTDELGELVSAMNAVLDRLRQLPLSLQDSAIRLLEAGHTLHLANVDQQQGLLLQAAALHEAQTSFQELKETSVVAAERADAVLQVAQRAGELGQGGEAAIEQSLAEFASMREFVTAIQGRLARLQERARQIGNIASTVKDLADQSNILALNAAIEALRSGEHGRGFGVIAKEMRALATQSASATTRIRGILAEVTHAIHDAAALGERGVQQMARGLARMNASGDSLRELSRMARESSAAARQIAVAVSQQSAGFIEIFRTISELSRHMDATLQRLESTETATVTLQSISYEVNEMARQFEEG